VSVTVIVTVAMFEVCPLSSVAVKVNVSSPLKSVFGV
jgi:hypothetical protein